MGEKITWRAKLFPNMRQSYDDLVDTDLSLEVFGSEYEISSLRPKLVGGSDSKDT